MRALMVGIASLSMVASPVLAQSNTQANTNQQSCASSLAKKASGQGYELVRQCDGRVAAKGLTGSTSPARQGVVNGASLGGEELPLWLILLGGAAAAAGVVIAVDGGDDDGDAVNPASPG